MRGKKTHKNSLEPPLEEMEREKENEEKNWKVIVLHVQSATKTTTTSGLSHAVAK